MSYLEYPNNIIIKKAQTSDINQLAKLFDAYRIFYHKSSDIPGAEQFLLKRLEQKDSVIYVAENSEDILVGFVQLYPLFSSTRMKKFWLLNDLYVDLKYRGQVISVKLIEQAKVLVRETKACGMFLETEKTNSIGNNLYPKVGFALNETSNYYEWENVDVTTR